MPPRKLIDNLEIYDVQTDDLQSLDDSEVLEFWVWTMKESESVKELYRYMKREKKASCTLRGIKLRPLSLYGCDQTQVHPCNLWRESVVIRRLKGWKRLISTCEQHSTCQPTLRWDMLSSNHCYIHPHFLLLQLIIWFTMFLVLEGSGSASECLKNLGMSQKPTLVLELKKFYCYCYRMYILSWKLCLVFKMKIHSCCEPFCIREYFMYWWSSLWAVKLTSFPFLTEERDVKNFEAPSRSRYNLASCVTLDE